MIFIIYTLNLFWSVDFYFYKLLFSSNNQFSGLWMTGVQAEERRGGRVAFKSIWQTPGPASHHLFITDHSQNSPATRLAGIWMEKNLIIGLHLSPDDDLRAELSWEYKLD